MRIYPLSETPKEAAQLTADVHLRPSVIAIAKFLSDAVHRLAPEKIATVTNSLGEVSYKFKYGGIAPVVEIMPPSKAENPWTEWVMQSRYNAWWLIDFAYQLNSEYVSRLKQDVQTGNIPQYMQIQEWNVAQIMQVFPQKDKKVGERVVEPFPIHLPKEEIVKIIATKVGSNEVDIYRDFYRAMRGKVRYKWTARPTPAFLFPDGDIPF